MQGSVAGDADAFITILSPNGNLLYSTYFGGNEQDIATGGIALDGSGNVYVAGYTGTGPGDFPTTPNAHQPSYGGGNTDCFLSKFNYDGNILTLSYSTYFGGGVLNDPAAPGDIPTGIALDGSGNVYISGQAADGFPILNASQSFGGDKHDAFVAKFDPSFNLIYSTYIGGDRIDSAGSVTTDSSGNAYVTGITYSNNLPTTQGAYQESFGGDHTDNDAFITKLDHTGGVIYSTYLGGSGKDSVDYRSSVDSSQNVYIAVATYSSSIDLPATPNALQSDTAGTQDTFLAILDPTGTFLIYSTYLGGSGKDSGAGVVLDNAGNIYVAVNTTSTDFPDFPTNLNSYQQNSAGSDEIFVTKIYIGDIITPPPTNISPVANAGPDQLGNVGEVLNFNGTGSSDSDGTIVSYEWNFGDGELVANGVNVNHSYANDGTFTVTLTVEDDDGATHSDEAVVTINIPNVAPIANAGPDQTVHAGHVVTLDGSGSDPDGNNPLSYEWIIVSLPTGSTALLSNTAIVNPTFTADLLGDYVIELKVIDSLGAVSVPDTVTISTTNTAPVAAAGDDELVLLTGTAVQLNGNQSYDDDGDDITYGLTYQWSFESVPAGSSATLSGANTATPIFVADIHGDYVVQLIVNDPWVSSPADTVTVSFNNIQPVADAGMSSSVVTYETVTLDSSGSSDKNGDPLTYSWSLTSSPAGSQAQITDSSAGITSFMPELPGTYVVELKVNDGFIDSDPDSIQIEAIDTPTVVIGVIQDADDVISSLPKSVFKNKNMQKTFINKLNAVIANIEIGNYTDALDQLQDDVLGKMNGCAETGAPDKNDWIRDCGAQGQVYSILMNAVTLLQELLNQ